MTTEIPSPIEERLEELSKTWEEQADAVGQDRGRLVADPASAAVLRSCASALRQEAAALRASTPSPDMMRVSEHHRLLNEAVDEAWDDVLRAVQRAWPEPQSYADCPTELIARLIDERDAALQGASTPLDGWQPIERLQLLAREEARRRHNHDRDQELDDRGNEIPPSLRHPGAFEGCPHPDCVLIRQALPAPPTTRG